MAATTAAWKRWLRVSLAIAIPSLAATLIMAILPAYKPGFFLVLVGGPWETVVMHPAEVAAWLQAAFVTLLAFAYPIFASPGMRLVSTIGIGWWLIAGFVLATGGY